MNATAAEQKKLDERFDKNGFATQETLDKLRERFALQRTGTGIIVNDELLAALVREINERRTLGEKIVAVLKAKGFAL
jgi:hypothetical protein